MAEFERGRKLRGDGVWSVRMDFVTSGPEAIVFERACPRRVSPSDVRPTRATAAGHILELTRGGGNWAAIRPSIHPSVCGATRSAASVRIGPRAVQQQLASAAAHHKRRHPVLFYYVIGRAVIYYIFKFTRGFAQIGLSLINTHRPILTPRSFSPFEWRGRVKTNFALAHCIWIWWWWWW